MKVAILLLRRIEAVRASAFGSWFTAALWLPDAVAVRQEASPRVRVHPVVGLAFADHALRRCRPEQRKDHLARQGH